MGPIWNVRSAYARAAAPARCRRPASVINACAAARNACWSSGSTTMPACASRIVLAARFSCGIAASTARPAVGRSALRGDPEPPASAWRRTTRTSAAASISDSGRRVGVAGGHVGDPPGQAIRRMPSTRRDGRNARQDPPQERPEDRSSCFRPSVPAYRNTGSVVLCSTAQGLDLGNAPVPLRGAQLGMTAARSPGIPQASRIGMKSGLMAITASDARRRRRSEPAKASR